MKYSIAQDIGRRERQEDRYLIDEKLGLFIVADGMGGHPRGDEAAQVAVDAFRAAIGGLPDATSPEDLRAALGAADRAVCNLKQSGGLHGRPGTTLTALWFVGLEVYLMHVGDSMAFHHEAGVVMQISERHGDAWGLDQALGGHYFIDELRPQIDLVRVCPGALYILCTDGMVLDKITLAALCKKYPVESLAEQIVRESLEHRKGSDNVTVVAIEVGP